MMSQTNTDLPIQKKESWRMFNEISPRYDLLNRVLSFGQDLKWRNRLQECLPHRGDQTLVDLATGTGDVAIQLVRNNQNVKQAYGIDLAEEMLKRGRAKIKKLGLTDAIELKTGDAQAIPLDQNTADTITMAFGIRNVENPILVLKEMHRVLKKGGRALILEFSMPANPLIRFFHLTYLRVIVPIIGGLISGNFKAYFYLNKTIEGFPYGIQFERMMKQCGFTDVRSTPLLFGTACIYQGDKANE